MPTITGVGKQPHVGNRPIARRPSEVAQEVVIGRLKMRTTANQIADRAVARVNGSEEKCLQKMPPAIVMIAPDVTRAAMRAMMRPVREDADDGVPGNGSAKKIWIAEIKAAHEVLRKNVQRPRPRMTLVARVREAAAVAMKRVVTKFEAVMRAIETTPTTWTTSSM
jgi:hypothetical protein